MKFSVIIPVYNVAPYLRECLESVLSQTYAVLEAICIDDGSTDGSGAILDEYAAKDARIKVVHKPNGGVSSARNRGLEEAKGEWILFLDGDDLFDADLLMRLAAIESKTEPVDMIGFGLHTFDESGNAKDYRFGDPIMAAFFQYAYRQNLAREVNFPGLSIGEDRVFEVRCLCRAKRLASVEGVSYRYRLRNGSVIRSKWSFRKRWDNFRHAVIMLGLTTVAPQANCRWVLRYIRRVFDTGVALFTGKAK